MAKQTPQEKTPPVAAPKRINRADAANQAVAAMNGSTTLGELAQRADDLFVAGGGVSKVQAATHHTRRALETAEALGHVKLTKPTDIMVQRV